MIYQRASISFVGHKLANLLTQVQFPLWWTRTPSLKSNLSPEGSGLLNLKSAVFLYYTLSNELWQMTSKSCLDLLFLPAHLREWNEPNCLVHMVTYVGQDGGISMRNGIIYNNYLCEWCFFPNPAPFTVEKSNALNFPQKAGTSYSYLIESQIIFLSSHKLIFECWCSNMQTLLTSHRKAPSLPRLVI